jgi:ABC-type multidrug transport system permease subunit
MNHPDKMRMILKFDTGADGFKKMILVLIVCALVVLGWGLYFLTVIYQQLFPNG